MKIATALEDDDQFEEEPYEDSTVAEVSPAQAYNAFEINMAGSPRRCRSRTSAFGFEVEELCSCKTNSVSKTD